jgi:O-acetyl-ADP-ribose deacetylase (regulator of RNase III)
MLLAACYRASLALARDHRARSIAFPAISCGVYGYPLDAAATIAVSEVRTFLADDAASPEHVWLVAFGDEVYAALHSALVSRAGSKS